MRAPHLAPSWAAKYVGLNYKPRGRLRAGTDCWGLGWMIFAEQAGIALPSYAGLYRGLRDLEAINAVVEAELTSGRWTPATGRAPRLFDLRHYRVAGGQTHVGITISRTQMLHACNDGGLSRLERFDTPYWAPRLLGVYRYGGPLELRIQASPFSVEHKAIAVPAGGTVREILEAAGLAGLQGASVWIGDRLVPSDAWDRVRPLAGRQVRVAAIPAGGGAGGDRNKAPRLVATIAVLAASIALPFGAGAPFLSATGTLTGAGSFLAGATGVLGSLLVNTLLPPPRPRLSDGESNRSRTVDGAANELRRHGTVPRPLGTHRFSPPYAAVPYTEVVGDDQFVRLIFAFYGPVNMTELKIGDTLIADMEGVEVETRDGRPGEAPLRLYPGLVTETPLSILLEQTASWQVRTTPVDTDEISVDATFPQGLAVLNANGSRSDRTVGLEVEYAVAGSGVWIPINSGSPTADRELDVLFRNPEATFGGSGGHTGRISWGAGFPDAKPGYLPASDYSWRADGYIQAPSTGSYTFAVDSSDAADLWIDDQLVVSWYGQHAPAGTPDYTAHTGTITLTAGRHRISVRMESRSALGNIAVGWQVPAGSMVTIPGASFTRDAAIAFVPGLLYQWWNNAGYSGSITTTERRTEPIRRNLAWAVARGQYDVRIRRVTADTTNPNIVDLVYWTVLRSFKNEDPIKKSGMAKVALRIKATDQLSGTLENFNLVAQSILPDWDSGTSTWIERGTSNNASCYRAVLQGPGNERPVADSRLDLEQLQAFHEDCDSNGFEFNAVLDTRSTVFERLADICGAGRAGFAMRNGLFSVVMDRAQTVPIQHFTPVNSFGFDFKRTFPDVIHGFRVGFINKDTGYQRDERIVLDDGYQIDGLDAFGVAAPLLPPATKFQVLELFGVVTPDEVFKHGRYHLAAAKLRPFTYSLSTDIEHIACTRGDLVLVTHDVPQWGLSSGRIKGTTENGGGDTTHLTLDEPAPMDAIGNYRIRVRMKSGNFYLGVVVAVEGNNWTIELATPITDADRPAVGDLFGFGPVDLETRELIVKSIAIESQMGARITLVDHAPAIQDADTGTIPDFESGITAPPHFSEGPETPVIEDIQSDDYVMVRETDGTLSPRMVIRLRPPSGLRPIPFAAQIRLRRQPSVGAYETRPLFPIDDNRVKVDRVEEGATYDILLRTVHSSGRVSPFVSATHTIIGKTRPPPDVQTFDVQRMIDGTRLFSWDLGVIPPDVAGVSIRYGPGGTGAWGDLTPLHDGILEGASPLELNVPPAGYWRFAIKMLDTSGNESVNAVLIDKTLGPERRDDVALSVDCRVEGWTGTKTGCFVSNDRTLEATSTDTWATLPATWDLWTRWNLHPVSPITYEQTLDAGFVFDFEPSATIVADGDYLIEFAYSTDGLSYTAFAPIDDFRTIAVTGRYARFRITITANGGFPVPRIQELVLYLRANTRVHTINDLDTSTLASAYRNSAGDLRLPVPNAMFTVIRSVGVSFNGTGAGWTWELLDRDVAPGPHVRLFNQQHLLSDATIDAVVRGY